MEKQEVKVISIPLIYIIAVIGAIIAIIVAFSKYKNTYNVNLVAKEIDESNSISISRTSENITSRSSDTSRIETEISDTSIIENENPENPENSDTSIIEAEISDNVVISEVEESQSYISIDDLTISEKMDLTVRTNLSKEDFVELISRLKADKSKFFYSNAELIYNLCEKYEINEIFFCGLISAESGWNIASNHRSTFNYISLMVNGKLKQFANVEDGLEQAAKTLHEKYLTPGGKFYCGKTLYDVKKKFCPSSSTWTSLVYGRMKQIYNCK